MTSARYLAVGIVLSISGLGLAQVSFNDANLKAAVEAELGISDPTPADMLGLTQLNANSSGITDLTGLEFGTNLTRLLLYNNQISDISALSGLTNLTELWLASNQISTISALSGLANLTELRLYLNQISDISALSGLNNLTKLWLGHNQISDISALLGLANLTRLLLADNQISDISVLSGMPNLARLLLYRNQISDISALLGLTNLETLDLSVNPLNQLACDVYVPQIIANNPGVTIARDCATQYSLVISSYPGGTVASPGEGPFAYVDASLVPVVATVDTGYHFVNWTGTAVDAGKVDDPSSASTSATVDGDYTLVANFAVNQYTVAVNSAAGGSTDKDGNNTVNYGDTLTIIPLANTGYHFTGWTGDASGSNDPLTVTVTSNMVITANFAINQYTVTVNSTAGGSTDKDGSNTVNHGATLTITPSADTDYQFIGWTGDASGTDDPLAVTVTSAMSIAADFESIVKPPVVVTYPAKDIGQTSATLMGYIPSDGGEADYEYRFELWKEGESEPESGDNANHTTWKAKRSLNGRSTFSDDLPEDGRPRIEPGFTYNYRAIGRNSAGSGQGGIRQFTTLTALYVDDNAPSDPGPHDMSISDPQSLRITGISWP